MATERVSYCAAQVKAITCMPNGRICVKRRGNQVQSDQQDWRFVSADVAYIDDDSYRVVMLLKREDK